MADPHLLRARAEFYERAHPSREFLDYVRAHHLDINRIAGFAGPVGVLPIADCGAGRFDFAEEAGPVAPSFVCEAFGEDGETVIDLVAWPLDHPDHVMTMFGRCGLLGAWEAMNPATYWLDYPLQMHRTPLDWLRAGCQGAAVVTPHVAARMLLDLPGRIAAQDAAHGRQLQKLMESVVDRDKIVIERRPAA